MLDQLREGDVVVVARLDRLARSTRDLLEIAELLKGGGAGRFWSTPARLLSAFPIDRRELAEHAALGLTEAQVRGATKTLEEVAFLSRAVTSGSERDGQESARLLAPILASPRQRTAERADGGWPRLL
jgi:resolvase-like protein